MHTHTHRPTQPKTRRSPRTHARYWGAPVIALVAMALAAAGCSSSGSAGSAQNTGTGQATADGDPTVNVAFAPISPFILPYIADSQGLDAKNGVHIAPTNYTSTATEIPSVLSGDINIGVAGAADALTAVGHGIPIKIISSVGSVASSAPDSAVLGLVTADSEVQSLKDLAGKRIGVNSLNTYNTLSALAAMVAAGVPANEVDFVQVPYSSLPSAVKNHQVEAAVLQEPALTQYKASGIRELRGLGPDIGAGSPAEVYFVSTSWASSHAKELRGAVAALSAAAELATSNQTLLRAQVLKQIPAPAGVGQKMQLPVFKTDMPASSFQALVDAMVKFKYIPKPIDPKDFLAVP